MDSKLHSKYFSSKRKWHRSRSTFTHDKVVSLLLQERKLVYSPKEQREKRKNVANFCNKRSISESLDRSSNGSYMIRFCHFFFKGICGGNINIFFIRKMFGKSNNWHDMSSCRRSQENHFLGFTKKFCKLTRGIRREHIIKVIG